MHERYHVTLDGSKTSITESPDGEWPRWHHARAAAITHLEEMIAEAEATLWVLRWSPTYAEYLWLRGASSAREEPKDVRQDQVPAGGTLR